MAPDVKLGEGHPSVRHCVVELCLLASTIDVFAGASHNDVVFSNRTTRMTVPSELHFSFWLKLIRTGHACYRHNLAHLEHRFGKLIEVTSSYDVNSCVENADLNSLEVMGEISWNLYCVAGDCLSASVV